MHNDFNAGMTAEAQRHGLRPLTPIEQEIIAVRHAPPKPCPYVPPADEPEPVVTLSMKRYFAAGTVTAGWVVVIAAATSASATVFAPVVSAVAWIVGGAVSLGVAAKVLRMLFTASETSQGGNTTTAQNVNVTVNVGGQNANVK